LPVLPIRPGGDKVSRASAASPLVEAGKVFLPEKAEWLADFMDEVTSFPSSPHDDMVDAMTQALNWLRGSGSYVDIDFQQRATAVFHEQSRLRAEHAEAAPGSHLSGGGFAWARAEDRAEAMVRNSPRWRFRGF
jgi:hypothetical protein